MRFDRWRYDPNSNVFKNDHITAVVGTVEQAQFLAQALVAEQVATLRRCVWMLDRMEEQVRRMQEGDE